MYSKSFLLSADTKGSSDTPTWLLAVAPVTAVAVLLAITALVIIIVLVKNKEGD